MTTPQAAPERPIDRVAQRLGLHPNQKNGRIAEGEFFALEVRIDREFQDDIAAAMNAAPEVTPSAESVLRNALEYIAKGNVYNCESPEEALEHFIKCAGTALTAAPTEQGVKK